MPPVHSGFHFWLLLFIERICGITSTDARGCIDRMIFCISISSSHVMPFELQPCCQRFFQIHVVCILSRTINDLTAWPRTFCSWAPCTLRIVSQPQHLAKHMQDGFHMIQNDLLEFVGFCLDSCSSCCFHQDCAGIVTFVWFCSVLIRFLKIVEFLCFLMISFRFCWDPWFHRFQ